jgi:uncharacterized RDD family membrane protein YckC
MEENQPPPQQEQHLFDDFSHQLTQAGSGKRLANYLIDLVSFYVFMYFMSYVIVEVSYDFAVLIYGGEGFNLAGRLIILVLYGMYMGLMEAAFKGRSLGKLITGTVAVNEDGSRISGQTALLRGLSRAVPFNAFSALGTPSYPWHDKWNKTYVVEYKDVNRS